MSEVKRYFKWCDRCGKTTEHLKEWIFFYARTGLICLECCPRVRYTEDTPPEGSFENPKPIAKTELNDLIRNARDGVYGTLGGCLVPYVDPIYLIDNVYYRVVPVTVALEKSNGNNSSSR